MDAMFFETTIQGVEVLNLRGPVSAQFELTSNCNYQCDFCYNVWKAKGISKPRSKPLTKKEHFYILEELSSMVFSVIFSGGEPTLIPWLPDLVRYLSSKRITCTMISNGSLIDKELAEKLKSAGLKNIQISLHHCEPSKNDILTGIEGSFLKTLKGAKNIADIFGKEKVNINMVANFGTSMDVLAMGKFLSENGFVNMSIGLQSCSGNAKQSNLQPTQESLESVCKQLSELSQKYKMRTGIVGGIPICSVPKNVDPAINFYNICDAAITQVVIGPDGNCRPCVESPWIGGNILSENLEDIWHSPIFLDIRMFKNTPVECRLCKHVSLCHGGCRASAYNYTGSTLGRDPLMPMEIPNDFILKES